MYAGGRLIAEPELLGPIGDVPAMPAPPGQPPTESAPGPQTGSGITPPPDDDGTGGCTSNCGGGGIPYTVYLLSSNGEIVTAVNNGGGAVRADRLAAGQYERVTLYDLNRRNPFSGDPGP